MFTGNRKKTSRRLEKKATDVPQEEKDTPLRNTTPWWRTKVDIYEKGSVDGNISAQAPVNRGWEGRPWLCRRGRLKGRW